MRQPIVVYGATGFTGRLVSAALARRNVAFRIAGRDEGKLRRLAGSLGRVPAAVVDVAPLDDARALEAMAARAKVVLDCAGPFATMGRPVLEACLAARTHFLDITGEVDWMAATRDRDAELQRRGIAAVNAVGFDVVPTDVAAALAAEALGGKVDAVKIAIGARGARTTQGTARSAVGILAGGGLAREGGRLVRERLGAHRWRVPFPDPIGPRDAMSAPLGDLLTSDRTTGASTVRCFFAAPPRLMGLAPLASIAMRLPGARGAAEAWIRRQPEGPSEAHRKRAVTIALAEASGANGSRVAWVRIGDAYDFTGECAALAAVLASSDGFSKAGHLSPVEAFGLRPLLQGISALGAAHGQV